MSTADELSTIGKKVSRLASQTVWSVKEAQTRRKRSGENHREILRHIKRGEKDLQVFGRKEVRRQLKDAKEYAVLYGGTARDWAKKLRDHDGSLKKQVQLMVDAGVPEDDARHALSAIREDLAKQLAGSVKSRDGYLDEAAAFKKKLDSASTCLKAGKEELASLRRQADIWLRAVGEANHAIDRSEHLRGIARKIHGRARSARRREQTTA